MKERIWISLYSSICFGVFSNQIFGWNLTRKVLNAEANFLTREANQWYREPASASARSPPSEHPELAR